MPSARSTIHGHVDSFKSLLDTFIRELEEMELTGLPDPPDVEPGPECSKVRQVLANLVEYVFDPKSCNLLDAYGGALAELGAAYRDWNKADKGQAGRSQRQQSVRKMREARQAMPRRVSWGTSPTATEKEFLEQLRRIFHPLCNVAGPEDVSVRLRKFRWRRKPLSTPKQAKRLADGRRMAFPRTYEQAIR